MNNTSRLLDRLAKAGELDLQFLQHRTTGRIHVIRPAMPLWMRTDNDDADSASDPDTVLSFALGLTLTLCGYRGIRHLGGYDNGDQLVSEFIDDRLCARCYRLLGPHSDLAFAHPQPKPGTATTS